MKKLICCSTAFDRGPMCLWISLKAIFEMPPKGCWNDTPGFVYTPYVETTAAWLDLPAELPKTRRLVFFPGSTIGNFEPASAGRFLHLLRQACGENGALLIGVDLRKDTAVLNAAYNDKAGLTAAFNLNVLEQVNRIVDSNFDPTCFHHHAFFNEVHSRVEMHLESLMDQKVSVAGQVLDLTAGETIHTENSYKNV